MIKIGNLRLSGRALEELPDPCTDKRLLPGYLWERDNARRVRHYHIALRNAMENCITPTQREQLVLHYWQGLKKSEIARLQNKGPSAVTKSMRAGMDAIREYVRQYMDIYDALEQEWLEEENS